MALARASTEKKQRKITHTVVKRVKNLNNYFLGLNRQSPMPALPTLNYSACSFVFLLTVHFLEFGGSVLDPKETLEFNSC